MQLGGVLDAGMDPLMRLQIIQSVKRLPAFDTNVSFILQQMGFGMVGKKVRPKKKNKS